MNQKKKTGTERGFGSSPAACYDPLSCPPLCLSSPQEQEDSTRAPTQQPGGHWQNNAGEEVCPLLPARRRLLPSPQTSRPGPSVSRSAKPSLLLVSQPAQTDRLHLRRHRPGKSIRSTPRASRVSPGSFCLCLTPGRPESGGTLPSRVHGGRGEACVNGDNKGYTAGAGAEGSCCLCPRTPPSSL